jgi:hypothetical protein
MWFDPADLACAQATAGGYRVGLVPSTVGSTGIAFLALSECTASKGGCCRFWRGA